MYMAKLRESLIFKLLLGVFVGLILGYSLDAKIGVNQETAQNIIGVINTIKFILRTGNKLYNSTYYSRIYSSCNN